MIHFFDLPREVRDIIYVQYVSIEGGYVLDFDSNTLRGANGEPIDLAFMLTCKKVAKEMKGVALSSNIITFSTFHSKEHETTAGRFNVMMDILHSVRGYLIGRIYHDTLSIPNDIWEALSKSHPKFAPYLDIVKNRPDFASRPRSEYIGPPGSCGETPSVFRNFVRSVLQAIVASKHCFNTDQFTKFEIGREDSNHISLESLVNLNPNYWSIPTRQGLEEMIFNMGKEPARRLNNWWDDDFPGLRINQIKHRYSAAAVAIRFLESLSKDSRASLRRILLNEDRAAVAFAECHGLGFVPYCQENPRLRVERRVSIWRTVFQTKTCNLRGRFMPPYEGVALSSDDISYPVAVWIVEALELESAGMPPGSFTMTFDGDWSCSEIFQTVVQRDAAWQAAIDLCLDRNILPPLSWLLRRRDARNELLGAEGEMWHLDNRWYLFEVFPQAIRDIVAETSIIKCNFALGEAWDVERLVEEHKEWTFDEWRAAWYDREKEELDPDPPSPSWAQLLCENSWETILPLSVEDEEYWHRQSLHSARNRLPGIY